MTTTCLITVVGLGKGILVEYFRSNRAFLVTVKFNGDHMTFIMLRCMWLPLVLEISTQWRLSMLRVDGFQDVVILHPYLPFTQHFLLNCTGKGLSTTTYRIIISILLLYHHDIYFSLVTIWPHHYDMYCSFITVWSLFYCCSTMTCIVVLLRYGLYSIAVVL